MSTSLHTPGPWHLDNVAANGEQVIGISRSAENGGASICEVDSSRDARRLVADARLIASAPELLAALQSMLAEFDHPSRILDPELSVDRPRIMARAAIAKAKGEVSK